MHNYQIMAPACPAYDVAHDLILEITTTTTPHSFTLPLVSGFTYNFIVSWGDGNEDTITAWNQTEATHSYATPGTYVLVITGLMQRWNVNDTAAIDQMITKIVNLGNTGLTNAQAMFKGCDKVTTIEGYADLGSSTMIDAFNGCSLHNSFPAWDFSSNVSFSWSWANNTSLEDVPANIFDTCIATNFTNVFFNCALTQTSVDNVLVSIEAAGTSNGLLDLNGGTNSVPSATGLAAKTTLEGRGWIVTVNT